jgi:RNA polymerase sigma factor (sigma-70 family)
MKSLKNGHGAAPAGEPEPGRGVSSSNADLVRAAWRGDKQAFVEIVARNQAMVCGIALSIVGNIAASEDVAQEAFLTAWRKIHELREPESLRAWLRQIARHVALGHQRRQRGFHVLEETPELPDLSPSPDEQAATEEEAALVRDALAQIPEIYREPLILYYRENQSTKAVAEALDISEDAVRQRLARGREMLRNRVSSVIESVLARTRPSGIFTTSIAVAIGALASPSAVAGGVFVAAASAGSPAATPASFLKGLIGSKTFLFLAAIVTVACLPVGYRMRAKSERGRIGVAPVEIKVVRPEAPRAVETSAIFAEWKRLHDTHGTNVEAMPNIYREIVGFKDSLRGQGFRAALMAEWVQLNPTNAMAQLRDRTIEAGLRRQFIDEWLVQDAGTAVEVFVNNGRGWETTVRNSLPELARRDSGRVASAVANLPRPANSSDSAVHDAFAILAEREIDSARAAAEAIEGPNRDQALAGVAQEWGKSDLDGAIAWARKLPGGTHRDEVIRSALVGAAMLDPLSALERVSLVPPGGRKGYFASTTGARVLKAASNVDFDATVGWLADHPGHLSDEDLMGLANVVGEKLKADAWGFLTKHAAAGSLGTMLPAITNALVKESSGQRRAVWEWLKGQPENSTTKELARHVLGTCGEQDAAMALRLAEDTPRTAEGEAQLVFLADGLLGHGALLYRLDELLEQAPQRLRQPLLESAFKHLTAETLADPQRWISLLSQLPDHARRQATESLAHAWAERTPEEAIGWAASMPAGEIRAGIVAAIASTWAAKDSPAASVWIAAMPPGVERDRSAQSLVLAMAEEFPREAWEWATSIGDAERRTVAAAHAAKMMAVRDSVTARALIDNGPFTPAAKAAVQSALETRSQSGRAP